MGLFDELISKLTGGVAVPVPVPAPAEATA
jgi:hypothetical protein